MLAPDRRDFRPWSRVALLCVLAIGLAACPSPNVSKKSLSLSLNRCTLIPPDPAQGLPTRAEVTVVATWQTSDQKRPALGLSVPATWFWTSLDSGREVPSDSSGFSPPAPGTRTGMEAIRWATTEAKERGLTDQLGTLGVRNPIILIDAGPHHSGKWKFVMTSPTAPATSAKIALFDSTGLEQHQVPLRCPPKVIRSLASATQG